MQPARPFRGAPYDKDMFTFLPAPSNIDVLTESSRKRKLSSSDNQITMPAPSVRYGFEMSDPKLNTGDWRSKVLRNSVAAFQPGESLHSGYYSHKGRNWEHHNYVASSDFDKRDLHETRPKYTGSSFSGQLHSPNHKDSLSLFHMSEVPTHKTSKRASLEAEDFNQCKDHESSAQLTREGNLADVQEFRKFAPHNPVQMKAIASVSHEQVVRESKSLHQPLLDSGALVVGSDGKGDHTHKTSAWPPSTAEGFNQLENHQSNARIARGENASHVQEFQNFGLEKPVQMKVVASRPHKQAYKNIQGSQCFKQHFINPGASFVGADGKCCPEETYNVESSSNVKRGVDTSTFAGCDSTRLFGDNVGNSLHNLQCETNDLLQNALRFLSASSGIDLAGSYGGKIQANGDEVKTMKSLPDSASQNVNQSQMETTLSNNDACPNLDKCGLNDEKDSVKLDQEHKSVNGASTPTEKLWDGTLQLSSSVTVSAIAAFKSGEKMQDFSWPGSVEVKGKVRLEAFEKYVQDLPRSRTRGLMVMSLRLKKGSSDSGYKGMKEVARKYKDGKKVGFAQFSSGVDMYICPNSDTIITILAKYGFFKGITAALDKSDPLLGCVVWRKNTPSVTTTKTPKVNDPQSGPSLSSPTPVAAENSAVPIKNQEPIMLSSAKGQKLIETGEKSRDMSPEFCVDQPKSPTAAKSNLVPISGTNAQFSELKTNRELDKPNLPLPSVAPKQSAVTSDDDDLPEYDFRITISQTSASKPFEARTVDSRLDTEQFRNCHVSKPMTAQMRPESSSVPGAPPNFHFQGQAPQNIGHQSESQALRLPIDPRKQIPQLTANPIMPDFQGLAPNNTRHQPELQIPSLALQQQKHIGNSAPSSKPRNLFDDDDMPEWCPPDFTKPMQELAQRPSQPIASSHSNAPVSGFKDSASGHLPSRLQTPALTQPRCQDKDYSSAPHHSRAASGFTDKGVAAPPGFAPNPAFRPRFDTAGRKKPIHPSSWRGLRQ